MEPTLGDLVVIAARATVVYLALLVGLRLMGKRELGQMTVFDLVMVFLLANAVQNAMVGSDVSVQGGLVAAFALLLVNRLVAAARLHSDVWGRFIEGSPTVLIQEGQVLDSAVRREGLERAQIQMAMREHGIDSFDDVRLAVMETERIHDGCPQLVPPIGGLVTGSFLKRHRTAKAGIGVPGRVSYSTGQLEYAPNPPANWAQWISDHRLAEVLGVKVSLANDASTAALGDDARLACAAEWGEAFGRRSSTGLGWIGRWKSEAVW
jgi:hypothetical protein